MNFFRKGHESQKSKRKYGNPEILSAELSDLQIYVGLTRDKLVHIGHAVRHDGEGAMNVRDEGPRSESSPIAEDQGHTWGAIELMRVLRAIEGVEGLVIEHGIEDLGQRLGIFDV